MTLSSTCYRQTKTANTSLLMRSFAKVAFQQKERARETLMGRRKATVLLVVLILQPFFSERNTTSSPPRKERDKVMKPHEEALHRLSCLQRLFSTMWMVPLFPLCYIACLDLLLRLVYVFCTLAVTRFTSETPSRFNSTRLVSGRTVCISRMRTDTRA